MIWLLAILTCFIGLGRGVDEGMTMLQENDPMNRKKNSDGVREHVWFPRYHLISVGWTLGLAALIVCAFASVLGWGEVRYVIVTLGPLRILGAGLLMWEAFEIGYNRARYRYWVPRYEFFTIDIYSVMLRRRWVVAWHILRTIAGVLSIILGG